MRIAIDTIPHERHRPEAGSTVGDWTFDTAGDLSIRVSALGDPDYEFLVGLHELVEAYLCRRRGISQDEVDAFDRTHSVYCEPGEHAESPYRQEHAFADAVERLMATELGVHWAQYEQAIETLDGSG